MKKFNILDDIIILKDMINDNIINIKDLIYNGTKYIFVYNENNYCIYSLTSHVLITIDRIFIIPYSPKNDSFLSSLNIVTRIEILPGLNHSPKYGAFIINDEVFVNNIKHPHDILSGMYVYRVGNNTYNDALELLNLNIINKTIDER